MSNTQRTPQQALKDAIKSGAVQAWIYGKKVEWRDPYNIDAWKTPYGVPDFASMGCQWRPAPEPKMRPWKDGSEVPKHAIYRDNRWDEHDWSLIIGASSEGIEISMCSHIKEISFADALKDGKHSTDNGKTWLPCGVMEGGE